MEILSLKTNADVLAALKNGEVKEYAREIRPNTQAKYCEMDEEGYVKDIDGVLQARKYDVVKFSYKHDSIAFAIDSAHIELFEDENHELITYEEKGEEYIAAQVVYKLGKVVAL